MKILLVEDNAKLNEAIRSYLDENGFEVDTAFNGVQGLSKVKDLKKKNSEEYDVIILDRMMPMKDGIEVLRDIKNMGINSGIILLTAKDTVDDKIFGLAAGADDYMVKPFNVKELIARIHSLYRRNILRNNISKNNDYFTETNVQNEPISQEIKNKNINFSFDLHTGEITIKTEKGSKKIQLTNKESNLFRLLVENEGKSISKDLILEKVWQDKEKPSSRFVDVHVHNLRNKLLRENFPGRIETVRSAGYMLILD